MCQDVGNVPLLSYFFSSKYFPKQNLHFGHTRLHTGEKYDCADCEYQGNTKEAVKVHKLTKHEGVGFLCDQYEFQAPTQWCLRRHTDYVHKV